MHKMLTVATDVSVCQSVCHAVPRDFVVQKTAQQIKFKVLFGLETLGDQMHAQY